METEMLIIGAIAFVSLVIVAIISLFDDKIFNRTVTYYRHDGKNIYKEKGNAYFVKLMFKKGNTLVLSRTRKGIEKKLNDFKNGKYSY